MDLTACIETWTLASPFRTAAVERLEVGLVVVEVHDGPHTGRGESFPHAAFGASAEQALREISGLGDVDREALQHALGPGPARDAMDQALWDLEAKRSGRRVWELLGLSVAPIATAYTIGIDTLDAMTHKARAHADWPVLKIKAEPDRCLQRVDAVRVGAPRAKLIVDGNESWSIDAYRELAPQLAERGVVLLEQPLHRRDDHALRGERPVPVCADESFRVAGDIELVRDRYDAVNIKLAKAGGLTAALAAHAAASAAGLDVLVGCMVTTSLAIAPAWVVAQGAAFSDLDGPLLLASDRSPGLIYDGHVVQAPSAALWG